MSITSPASASLSTARAGAPGDGDAAFGCAAGHPAHLRRPLHGSGAHARLIIDTVAAAYGYTSADLRGPHRTADLVSTRRLAIWLLHIDLGLSNRRIGTLIGRDASTIVHHLHAVSDRLSSADASARTTGLRHMLDLLRADILTRERERTAS